MAALALHGLAVAIALFVALLFGQVTLPELPTTIEGQVTYYGKNKMEATYTKRLLWEHVEPCKHCIGMLAVGIDTPNDMRRLNDVAYIKRPGQPFEGPFLCVDVGQFLTPNRIAEVDYRTAMRWQMNGPLNDVKIFFMERHK